MRVDLVCFSGGSGLGDYSLCLAKALSELGTHEVTIVTNDKMPNVLQGQFGSIKEIFHRTRDLWIEYIKFTLYIIKRKPDVVVFQSWIKLPLIDALIILLFRAKKIACVCTVHDLVPHKPIITSQFELDLFFKSFDGLVVHSHAALKNLQMRKVNTPAEIAPHGSYDLFDTLSLSQTKAREAFPELRANDFVVLFFGHLEHRKGILALIEAADALQSCGRVKILIAGDSGLNANERLKLERARCFHNVVLHDHFIPFDQVQYYFKASDVVILPYIEGSTSGVLKLAIAFERPVIATPVGDIPEMLCASDTDKAIGITIETDGIVENIHNSILEMEKRHTRFKSALQESKRLYSWGHIGLKYSEWLTEIMTQRAQKNYGRKRDI